MKLFIGLDQVMKISNDKGKSAEAYRELFLEAALNKIYDKVKEAIINSKITGNQRFNYSIEINITKEI